MFSGNFYNEDYFEHGRITGKGWYENYHWMPQRSFREALACIDTLGLNENSFVLDFGCAKGFLVRALRELEIRADGCDISDYALKTAPVGCWNCSDADRIDFTPRYTHIIAKDVFEHIHVDRLSYTLQMLGKLAPTLMCVVPLGDSGVYRIPVYHAEASHVIAENEAWWVDMFTKSGWIVRMKAYRIKGLKDNWAQYPQGNYFIIARFTG